MEQPKISVIVPVYKVEPYLRKCLDSIVKQTYSNLEIILVDDGSPDSCGAVCDEYAENDGRIVVIHQKNGGLSAARNAALEIATGEFVGFVDSDDWIEPDMYEYLLRNALMANAEITVCGHILEYGNVSCTVPFPEWGKIDRDCALEALLENKVMHNQVWDKLWKRELFCGVRFPVGRTFEDMAIAYRLFEKAEHVLCLPEAKYHYLQRSDSILGDVSLRNRMNSLLAVRERYEEMYEQYPQFCVLLENTCVAESVCVWACYWYNSREEREKYRVQLKEISDFSRPRWKQAFKDTNLGVLGRMVICLLPYPTWWSFGLAWLIGRIYKLRHGKLL